jgi:hypothetical protein
MPTVLRWAAACLLTWALGVPVLVNLMRSYDVASPGFALLLNMALPLWVVAFFAITAPPVDHPWLEAYFRPRRWERAGEIYRALGVRPFQAVLKVLRLGVFGMRPHDFRVTGDAAFLLRMERDTRSAEAAHGVCFIIVVGFAVYAAATGRIDGAAWLLLAGIVCHAYPMLLQRHHRPRWRRVMHRSHAGLEPATFGDAPVGEGVESRTASS